jgi:hypothetical protein
LEALEENKKLYTALLKEKNERSLSWKECGREK